MMTDTSEYWKAGATVFQQGKYGEGLLKATIHKVHKTGRFVLSSGGAQFTIADDGLSAKHSERWGSIRLLPNTTEVLARYNRHLSLRNAQRIISNEIERLKAIKSDDLLNEARAITERARVADLGVG
jgi:hypothetical protein